MNVGNKTLSQLSDEAKEKRYVTLEVGAKVSGYTKDYLEHLCRLNKVEFSLWNKGQFVIELESLLTETHTILLSYEDINFVDKETLDDPTPQIVTRILTERGGGVESLATASAASDEVREKLKQKVHDGITQSVPTFGEVNQTAESLGGEPTLSRVGRSVVSDPLHPEVPHVIPPPPIARIAFAQVPQKEERADVVASQTPLSIGDAAVRVPIHLAINSTEKGAVVAEQFQKTRSPFHLRVTGEAETAPEPAPSVIPVAPTRGSGVGESIVAATAQRSTAMKTPELHPIQTSVDGSVHHDDAPLFPLIQKITETEFSGEEGGAASEDPHLLPGIPYLGEDSRTVVFSDTASRVGGGEKTDGVRDLHRPLVSVPMKPAPISPANAIYHPLHTPAPISTMPRPSMIPAIKSEQQLALPEIRSLVRSPVFNVAFIACLMFSSLAIGGFFSGTTLAIPGGNVAAVASSLPTDFAVADELGGHGKDVEYQIPPPETLILPFSDDVIISTSTTPNAVIVQPVFEGVPGQKYEYVIIPTGN